MAVIYWRSMARAILPPRRFTVRRAYTMATATGRSRIIHQMLGAAIIHPDVREVIPLMPEPIVNRDGTSKNDCERNAAKRFVAKLRQDHPTSRSSSPKIA
jgi:hypothetical protein